jgi:hypothetical protein
MSSPADVSFTGAGGATFSCAVIYGAYESLGIGRLYADPGCLANRRFEIERYMAAFGACYGGQFTVVISGVH